MDTVNDEKQSSENTGADSAGSTAADPQGSAADPQGANSHDTTEPVATTETKKTTTNPIATAQGSTLSEKLDEVKNGAPQNGYAHHPVLHGILQSLAGEIDALRGELERIKGDLDL